MEIFIFLKVFKMFDRTIEQQRCFCISSNKKILTSSSVAQGNYPTIEFSPILIQLPFIHPFIHFFVSSSEFPPESRARDKNLCKKVLEGGSHPKEQNRETRDRGKAST